MPELSETGKDSKNPLHTYFAIAINPSTSVDSASHLALDASYLDGLGGVIGLFVGGVGLQDRGSARDGPLSMALVGWNFQMELSGVNVHWKSSCLPRY